MLLSPVGLGVPSPCLAPLACLRVGLAGPCFGSFFSRGFCQVWAPPGPTTGRAVGACCASWGAVLQPVWDNNKQNLHVVMELYAIGIVWGHAEFQERQPHISIMHLQGQLVAAAKYGAHVSKLHNTRLSVVPL